MLHYARMIMISGYAVSLVATTLGSILMIGLRRLRCTRIWIHINLQLSFLLRAAIWLLHDVYSSKFSLPIWVRPESFKPNII